MTTDEMQGAFQIIHSYKPGMMVQVQTSQNRDKTLLSSVFTQTKNSSLALGEEEGSDDSAVTFGTDA